MKKILIGAAILGSAAAAFAQAPESRTTRTGPDQDQQKVVCISALETGSLTRRTRTCKTRAQWEAVRRENQQHVEKVQQYKVTAGN